MYLVFCDSNDISAIWAYHALKTRELQIDLVTSEMLAYSLSWEHRIKSEGVTTNIKLADGRRIDTRDLHGVINRIQTIPSNHLQATAEDKRYAIQEFYALFLSWIYALPKPVLNRPTPQGLAGRWRHASEWTLLAHQSGLFTSSYEQSSFDEGGSHQLGGRLVPYGTPVKTLIVVNTEVMGREAPDDVVKGCTRLAELAETPLLGVDFTEVQADDWCFAGASPMPDLRLGGERLLNALEQALRGGIEGVQ